MAHSVTLTPRAKRHYAKLADSLKRAIVDEIKAMQSDGLPAYAEKLERELETKYKIKINGWRIILMLIENDSILILDIRERNRRTYLNVP